MKSNPSARRRFGFVSASPAEHLVHQRFGRLRFPGRGAAAWVVPGLDRAFLIPSSVQSAAFLADQITVEIKSVQILSTELFENLQAKFRDAQRLESARSKMETDEAIACARAADRETAAQRDLSFRLAEIQREEGTRRQEIARNRRLEEAQEGAQREREMARLDGELALVRAREEYQRAALAAAEALIEIEETLETRRHRTEQFRGEQRERLAAIDDAIARRSIETANRKDCGRLLVEALPDLFAGLNLGTVNLGDPALVAGVQGLLRQIATREVSTLGGEDSIGTAEADGKASPR